MARQDVNIFKPKNFPFWIVLLNYISLAGLIFYPLTAIAQYARQGDHSFYQPTAFEYLLIYIYPFILMLISWVSYTIFDSNKIISAALPITVLIFYLLFLKSGLFLKIVPVVFW